MHWIFAHLIGDFIIQTDWMESNKKQSDFACLVHVLAYMSPFLFCGLNWWQMLLIGAQHYAQDRTNFILWFMKIKKSRKFIEKPYAPWSIILTDNIIHILWIGLVVWINSVV